MLRSLHTSVSPRGWAVRSEADAFVAVSPTYFALVMATGIVSIAAHVHRWELLAKALFALNVGAYLLIWALTVVRFIRFRAQFISDLTHHSRGATFLTITAATCVLGSQFALLTPLSSVALGLWFLGGGLGLLLNYTFFVALTVCDPKPSLETGISGSWLLAVVATESISVLGTLVAPSLECVHEALFIALAVYLAGAMLYIFFVTLILYRWLFFRMLPEKLTPDYWIDMGALAITALAGTLLLQASDRWQLLGDLKPFLTGSALLFWATGSWWIPLLLSVELWRHLRGRVPWAYSPDYWSLVFPLGMYSTATSLLARVADLEFVTVLGEVFFFAALLAWAVVFAGMIRNLVKSIRPGVEQARAASRAGFPTHPGNYAGPRHP